MGEEIRDKQTEEPTFQAAVPGDRATILEMMRRFYAIDAYPFDAEKVRTVLDTLLDDPSLGRVWLIAKNAEPIGYLVLAFGYSLEYGGRDAFIDELFIVESHRGRGIGTRAMEFAAEQCKALGVRALHLEVERGNRAGQALYRKVGFADNDRLLMTKTIR